MKLTYANEIRNYKMLPHIFPLKYIISPTITPFMALYCNCQYLGVTIQSDPKWDSHIHEKIVNANSTLGLIWRNIRVSSANTKEVACKSLVRLCLHSVPRWQQFLHWRCWKARVQPVGMELLCSKNYWALCFWAVLQWSHIMPLRKCPLFPKLCH